MYGKGLNSIRVRFTLAIALLGACAGVLMLAVEAHAHPYELTTLGRTVILVSAALIPGVATYWLAGRLTRPLEELRRSTEALAAGASNVPVAVDCRCEVGGLADAFRKMVDRFNSNIMRMNVLAYSDGVTQLPNRAALFHVLRYATAPQNAPFEAAVLFIDLDNFKQVNDTLGHEAGDELLRAVTERILWEAFGKTVATLDTCLTPLGEMCDYVPRDVLFARFAGDEFVALVPGITERGAVEAVARSIIAALAAPFSIRGTEVTVGTSIGIACTPADGTDGAELVSFADLAMYAAKRGGRNRHVFFDGRLRAEAQARMAMELELRAALERNDLYVEFQPKVLTADLSLAGVEALARMRDGAGNPVPPSAFISVAEGCGLIEKVGDIVVEKAILQARRWHEAGLTMPVAVNVSPIQFARPGFTDRLIEMVRDSGLPAGLIEVEVTESAAMLDVAATRHRLGALREAGVRIAIDDFGTGFSNLSQLVRLPYDVLKIDRSLVAGIGTDPRSETILSAVMMTARGLGHTTVAEGVEEHRQLAFLSRHGCTAVQGFLFARPMSAGEIEDWMRSRNAAPDLGHARLQAALPLFAQAQAG